MNEFEWLRQTRALNRPQGPAHDLWPAIAGRLQAAERPRARHRPLPWAMAAAVVLLSVMAGSLSLRQQPPAPASHAVAATGTPWKPKDPRLSGAAIELHAADAELAQALKQAPNAAFLQRLLQNTAEQRSRLQRLEHEAG